MAGRTLTDGVLESLAATCRKVRASKPLPAAACGKLITDAPPPGTVVKAKRGNRFKHGPTIQAGKAGLAARRKESAAAKVVQARSKPMGRAARIRAERLPSGVAVNQRQPKRKAPAGRVAQ